MKKILMVFAFAALLFACKTEKADMDTDAAAEELKQEVMEENAAELANFEYVCDHCKIGSNKSGKCACGMDYEKNPNFVAAHQHDGEEGHDHGDHDGHDHEDHDVEEM